MYRLRTHAEALMAMPDGAGTTAGPMFDYAPPELRGPIPSHGRRIVVLPDGPYLVHGGTALRRKTKIVSPENQDALTWRTGPDLETEPTYALCRCGQSSTKPFCDGTHAYVGFDGTENAVVTPYRELQHVHDGQAGRNLSARRQSPDRQLTIGACAPCSRGAGPDAQ